MSGGFFDYQQYTINDIKEKIEDYLNDNEYGYSEQTLKEFMIAISLLRKSYIYSQRIDYLLSDDDGEYSFHERLKEDLSKLYE